MKGRAALPSSHPSIHLPKTLSVSLETTMQFALDNTMIKKTLNLKKQANKTNKQKTKTLTLPPRNLKFNEVENVHNNFYPTIPIKPPL